MEKETRSRVGLGRSQVESAATEEKNLEIVALERVRRGWGSIWVLNGSKEMHFLGAAVGEGQGRSAL